MPAAKSLLLRASLSEDSISVAIQEKREYLERLVSKPNLIKSHQTFILQRIALLFLSCNIHCVSSAHSHMEDLERFDDALVAALVTVTNIRFGENSLAQVALPDRQGSLGIRMAKYIALPAFISFLHVVRELFDGILNNILLLEKNLIFRLRRENGAVTAWL